MGFTFAAASYIVALICDAFLIFFAIFHTIAFDELKTDYKWVQNNFYCFIFIRFPQAQGSPIIRAILLSLQESNW